MNIISGFVGAVVFGVLAYGAMVMGVNPVGVAIPALLGFFVVGIAVH